MKYIFFVPMIRGKRAAVRPSVLLFEGPLHFVSFVNDKGFTEYGHCVSADTETGMATVLPELTSTHITISSDTVKTLTNSDMLPEIPPSVSSGDGTTRRAHTGSSIDFLSFTIPTGAPGVLFVRKSDNASHPLAIVDLISAITRVVDPALGVPESVVTACVDGWLPCSHFGLASEHHEVAIAVVKLTPLGVEQSTRAAHALAASGFVVSSPFATQGSCGPAPFSRVTSSVLKWIKDADVMTDLSSIVDQLPGLLHGTAKRDVGGNGSARDRDVDPSILTNVIYDAGFNVQRLMICWGMLAASLSRVVDDITHLPEPLQSYVRLVRGFERMRESHGSDAVDAVDLTKSLTYNVAPKMTVPQASNALTLFYWAAVHEDDATRAIPKDVARRALEMYIPFGHVILRKRAYRFSS